MALVLIQPVGAVGIFGLANQKSFGHVHPYNFNCPGRDAFKPLSVRANGRPVSGGGSAYTYVGVV